MTQMVTDPSTLPQWEGRPVPWVTRWTGEKPRDPLQVAMDPMTRDVLVHYGDGRHEEREPSGMLWMREGIQRGGTPEYSQVSVYRQRASMRRRLCQVCGKAIPGKVIHWLLDPRQIVARESGATITFSPPTCESCIPLALELCPALKRRHTIAKVLDYRLWGVYATVVRVGQDGQPQQTDNALIDYERTDYPFRPHAVIARQQVVEWTKFVLE